MEYAALISFLALIVGWMAMPADGRAGREPVPASQPRTVGAEA